MLIIEDPTTGHEDSRFPRRSKILQRKAILPLVITRWKSLVLRLLDLPIYGS